MSATSTLPAARSQRPRFGLVAARTAKPFRPAQAEQILPAGLLAAESSFEFRQCPRIVLHQLFHEPPHYLLWLPESSGYPISRHSGSPSTKPSPYLTSTRARVEIPRRAERSWHRRESPMMLALSHRILTLTTCGITMIPRKASSTMSTGWSPHLRTGQRGSSRLTAIFTSYSFLSPNPQPTT